MQTDTKAVAESIPQSELHNGTNGIPTPGLPDDVDPPLPPPVPRIGDLVADLTTTAERMLDTAELMRKFARSGQVPTWMKSVVERHAEEMHGAADLAMSWAFGLQPHCAYPDCSCHWQAGYETCEEPEVCLLGHPKANSVDSSGN